MYFWSSCTISNPPMCHVSSLIQAPPEALARSVLAEVPAQVVGFFTSTGLNPPADNNRSTNPTPALVGTV